eukprot:1192383-Prorocentrum_minimum.AAC.5
MRRPATCGGGASRWASVDNGRAKCARFLRDFALPSGAARSVVSTHMILEEIRDDQSDWWTVAEVSQVTNHRRAPRALIDEAAEAGL